VKLYVKLYVASRTPCALISAHSLKCLQSFPNLGGVMSAFFRNSDNWYANIALLPTYNLFEFYIIYLFFFILKRSHEEIIGVPVQPTAGPCQL
jgi:hypothetical protein